MAGRKSQDSLGLWAAGYGCTGCVLHKVRRQGGKWLAHTALTSLAHGLGYIYQGKKHLFLICTQILYGLVADGLDHPLIKTSVFV